MKYRKSEAKEYFKENLKGVWCATYTPFTPDYKLDEEACRHNIRYCIDVLNCQGNFHAGIVGETFHQTIPERKRHLQIAVEESDGKMMTIASPLCETPEYTLELIRYAEDIGADLVGVINPRFYFESMTNEGVFQYYKYLADRVNIAFLLFNQMEHGYLMSPQLIARLANEIPNVVAIKDVAPPDHIKKTRILCGDKILVSDVREDTWFINLTVNGQTALIAPAAPYLLQSKKSQLLNRYTELAMKGEIAKAWEAYRDLEPIRRALQSVMVPGKTQAVWKYWSQLLGMAGGDGRVRMPQMGLIDAEKQAIKKAVESTGLL